VKKKKAGRIAKYSRTKKEKNKTAKGRGQCQQYKAATNTKIPEQGQKTLPPPLRRSPSLASDGGYENTIPMFLPHLFRFSFPSLVIFYFVFLVVLRV